MVPWPTLITGAVGAAGILGTILAARMAAATETANLRLSINAENDRGRRADKRQVYAACQASFSSIVRAAAMERDSRLGSSGSINIPDALAGLVKASNDMYIALSELKLIAPGNIGRMAEAIVRFWENYTERVRKGGTLEEMESIFPVLQNELYAAMRADLGEPVE